MTKRTVLVLGATGLIGQQLIPALEKDDDIAVIKVLTRRPLGWTGSKIHEILIDFDAFPAENELFTCDDLFISFGTTMAKAGSQAVFLQIDFQIPLEIAKRAKNSGARQCLLVSAVDADAHSKIFYNKVKGELEDQIAALKFPSFLIFRPSMLLGNRSEKRFAERIGISIFQFLRWINPRLLGKYSGMPATLLAEAMAAASRLPNSGKQIFHYRQISSFLQKTTQ